LLGEECSGAEDASPIQSLDNKLLKDSPLALSTPVLNAHERARGESSVCLSPDFSADKNQAGD
jgi:hypothetical protein